MGKPYWSELARLQQTYAWALDQPIDGLANAVGVGSTYPLVVSGSGGSLSAAHLCASLHQDYASRLARVFTPLELPSGSMGLRQTSVILMSAGGRNTDILNALRRVASQEPPRLTVITCAPGSPLSDRARSSGFAESFDFDLPAGKDGFLSTNSMLALSVLLARAYARAFGGGEPLPCDLDRLTAPLGPPGAMLEGLRQTCVPLWSRDTLSVLFGPATRPAAMDLESRFTEAALGAVHIADYRNFGHGRHHWLAKRGAGTAVLALAAGEDGRLPDQTLTLLPPEVPVVRLNVGEGGVGASLTGLLATLHLAGFAGDARGIDPGRPGVPEFGRKLYNLRPPLPRRRGGGEVPERSAAAIERKAGLSVRQLSTTGTLESWLDSYGRFVERVAAATYAGIILDYDGTLCDARHRAEGPSQHVINALERLLGAGLAVGIATGRGDSIWTVLQPRIDKAFASQLHIGYHNCAFIRPLSDQLDADADLPPCEELASVAERLRADPTIGALAHCRWYHKQITVRPRLYAFQEVVWERVFQISHETVHAGVQVVRSSHSIDVLAPGVGKTAMMAHIRNATGLRDAPILCIGDRGRAPGNDFPLLTTPHSLSVDEVSPDPSTCWNLAELGCRGVQATLGYLAGIQVHDGSATISLKPVRRRER